MSFLLAQAGGFLGGYSIAQIAIFVVIVAAIIALVYVALNQFGVGIPGWAIHVMWIIIVAIVVILAIKFVAGVV